MKKRYLLLFLFFSAIEITAQSRYSIFFDSGYSFSNTIKLDDTEVKESKGFVITFGGMMKLFSIKKKYVEIGVAGKTIFASGSVNGERFNASTLRLVFPLKMTIPLTEKWEVATGFNFQNNIDLTTTDLKLGEKYLLRVDYVAGVKYLIVNEWYLTANANVNLRNIPDSFFLNDPKFALLLGVVKTI